MATPVTARQTATAETPPLARRHWQVMGTVASLACADEETAARAEAIAGEVLAAADARFSSYRPDSEFARFARGEVAEPSPPLAEVLAACTWLADASDGVFSMWPDGPDAPPDVAGYVKGWAVDAAADALAAAGIGCYALGVGGDWRCAGGHPSGRPWQFALLDPRNRSAARAVASLRAGAVATSGRYERGDHVRLPPGADAPDWTPDGPASFSVTGPRLAWADAFATVGLLLGDAGLTWVGSFAGYAGAVVRADGTMVADAAFPVVGRDPQGADGFVLHGGFPDAGCGAVRAGCGAVPGGR